MHMHIIIRENDNGQSFAIFGTFWEVITRQNLPK